MFTLEGFNKYFSNINWLLLENVVGKLLTLVISFMVARYLGPGKYGMLSYSVSLVGLFVFLSDLGLEDIVVREIVKDEQKRDKVLGTAFILRSMGSIALLAVVVLILVLAPNGDSRFLILIIAFGSVFRSFQVIEAFFRAKVVSKYSVFARLITIVIVSTLKLILIALGSGVKYFAMVVLFEQLLLSFWLVVMYKRYFSGFRFWKYSAGMAVELLKESWPLILTGAAVATYMRIDQVMIKYMLTFRDVGDYAAAVRLSEAWYFIPTVIVGSLFPAIVNAKGAAERLYVRRLKSIYTLMFWMGIIVAVPVTMFSGKIISMVFGPDYMAAVPVLSVHVWSAVFVFLGVASGKYLVAEHLTRISFFRTVIGAATNVILNFFLIPVYGIMGAAIATLVSYFVSVFFIVFIRETREQAWYMLCSVNPFNLVAG